ncbi:MAG: cyclophilin family peptidyl-prolyl cis-trans isomerase [Mariniblastus sp.]|jgi:cyclophilin family peptidyl-prolyl cis-trans isomerase
MRFAFNSLLAVSLTVLAWQSISSQAMSQTNDPVAAFGLKQETQATPIAPPQEEQPLEKSFEDIVREVQSNEFKINSLFSSIPIGFPKLQAAHMKKIAELREVNEVLNSELETAALSSYEKDPENNPQATRMVYEMLVRKLDGSSGKFTFDPNGALELSDLMLKTGIGTQANVDKGDIAYQAFRASFAIQDYSRAEMMLAKMEENGRKADLSWTTYLKDAQECWQKELEIRSRETVADDLPQVKFKTSEGDFVVELFENQAPKTVGNFISLIERNFYNDLPFFEVRPSVSAETGCPNGDGTGDPGYQIPCEWENEGARSHFTGTLSMSNNGKDTGGSQFFITHQRIPTFDEKYTVFGRVIEGLEVVYRLKQADGSFTAKDARSKIITATVVRKRDHVYAPTPIEKQ